MVDPVTGRWNIVSGVEVELLFAGRHEAAYVEAQVQEVHAAHHLTEEEKEAAIHGLLEDDASSDITDSSEIDHDMIAAASADLPDARLLAARRLDARLLDARLLDARRREASRYEASCHDAHGAPPCAFHILQAAAAFPRGAAT